MAKHIIVTTEAQDTVMSELGIPITNVVQIAGPETTVYTVAYNARRLFARLTTIEPDGSATTRYRDYQFGSGWVEEEPNSLSIAGYHE
jgi:hypothetical protein